MVKLGKKPSKTRRYRDLIDGPLKNRRSMAIASSRVRLFRLFFMKKNFYFSVSFSFFDSSDAVRRVALCFVVFFCFVFVLFFPFSCSCSCIFGTKRDVAGDAIHHVVPNSLRPSIKSSAPNPLPLQKKTKQSKKPTTPVQVQT